MLGHAGIPFVARDRKTPDREGGCDGHAVLRAFAAVAFRLAGGRAHGEGALGHHHHFRAGVAFLETVFWLERPLAFRC